MKKKLRISFNGKTYDVLAELLEDDESSPYPLAAAPVAGKPPLAAPTPVNSSPTAPVAPAPGSIDGGLLSPLAGRVASIDTSIGARVHAGQPVITLEAMKMNTVVSAPTEGTIASIHVNAGDSVQEGQLLLVIN